MESVMIGPEITVELALSRLIIAGALSVIFAFLVEGAVDGVFNWRLLQPIFEKVAAIKYPLAVLLSYAVCSYGGFSIVEVVYSGRLYPLQDLSFDEGIVITALFVARGSKWVAEQFGSMKKTIQDSAK